MLQASLPAAATKTAEFYLVNESGERVQKLRMKPVTADREFLEFVEAVELPTTPFRVAIMERDPWDRQYQGTPIDL
jgi:hypothetical protein